MAKTSGFLAAARLLALGGLIGFLGNQLWVTYLVAIILFGSAAVVTAPPVWKRLPFTTDTGLDSPAVSLVREPSDTHLFVPAPERGSHGGGIGTGGLGLVIWRSSPVLIERLSLAARVWFHTEGRSGTSQAVAASGTEASFIHRGLDWEYQWDMSDPQIWQLQGLPVTIQPYGRIRLPAVMVHIKDPDEALRLFTESQRATLGLDIKVRTDVGTFSLEKDIPLVMSRNDGSILGPINDLGLKL